MLWEQAQGVKWSSVSAKQGQSRFVSESEKQTAGADARGTSLKKDFGRSGKEFEVYLLDNNEIVQVYKVCKYTFILPRGAPAISPGAARAPPPPTVSPPPWTPCRDTPQDFLFNLLPPILLGHLHGGAPGWYPRPLVQAARDVLQCGNMHSLLVASGSVFPLFLGSGPPLGALSSSSLCLLAYHSSSLTRLSQTLLFSSCLFQAGGLSLLYTRISLGS